MAGIYKLKGRPSRNYDDLSAETKRSLNGFSPQMILKIAEKALMFWDKQRSLQAQYYKKVAIKNSSRVKELTSKLRSEQLKYQTETNNLTQEKIKYKNYAMKYKNGHGKLLKNYQKLQKDLSDKKRQFQVLNKKYSQSLKTKNSKAITNHSRNRNNSLPLVPENEHQSITTGTTCFDTHSTNSINPSINNHNNYHQTNTQSQYGLSQSHALSQSQQPQRHRNQQRNRQINHQRSFKRRLSPIQQQPNQQRKRQRTNSINSNLFDSHSNPHSNTDLNSVQKPVFFVFFSVVK